MNDLEVIKRHFAEWLSLPACKRVPRTQTEFAKENRISREQLSRWKKLPDFKREVADAGLDWFSSDDINDIVFALKSKAKDGNPQAIKMCLEMAGVIGGKEDDKPKTPDQMKNLSEADLKKLATDGGA